MLLAMMECRLSIQGKSQLTEKVLQTVCYMLCPLAHSRWGVFKSAEPLIALLVTPTCIYRLTLSKPDIQKHPFGLHLQIEKTTNAKKMGWVVHEHINRYINDFKSLQRDSDLAMPIVVDPGLWTPMNLLARFQMTPVPAPNLGFVYSTSGKVINDITEYYSAEFQNLPNNMNIVVKHVLALLTVNYVESLNSIEKLLMMEAAAKETEAIAKKNERLMQELSEAKLKLADRTTGGSLDIAAKSSPPAGLNPATPANLQLGSLDGTETSSPPDSNSGIRNVLSIKHPYLGVLYLEKNNPLLVMRNVGETLGSLLNNRSFRLEWRTKPLLRKSFLRDIGLSALCLVQSVDLCHNDIRPHNIAFEGGSFCLIDFDLSRKEMLQQKSAFSPDLDSKGLWDWKAKEHAMCYSVAQIALTVFLLSGFSDFTMSEISRATEIWDEVRSPHSKVDSAFEKWVGSLEDIAKSFISSVRQAGRAPTAASTRLFPPAFSQHLVRVLESMLCSQGALGPDVLGLRSAAKRPHRGGGNEDDDGFPDT